MLSNHSRLWHPYTRFSAQADMPLIVRGKGIHLYDKQGRKFIDAVSSWWACALGHGHRRIIDAIQRQADSLQHSILGNLSHPAAVDLAARLAELMPTPDRHVLFSSDGASAVEASLKIALQYFHNTGRPERKRFAYLQNAYHGDTLGAVSVGYLEQFHKPFESILFTAFRVPVPLKGDQENACYEATARLFAEHGHEIAGLIVEPLCQGAAGMRMYSAAYLKRLSDLCKAQDVLLIDDEIAMGFGRTGRMFAFEHAGIDPDLVCVGKALSAGYLPISAVIVKNGIYNTFADKPEDHTFYHGHTFSGNPLCAAASIEALKVYSEERIAEKAAALETVMRRELSALNGHPLVLDARFLGAIGVVELAHAKEGRVAPARMVRETLFRKGILIRPLGNVVYLMPPLITTEEEMKTICSELVAAIHSADSKSQG